MTEYWVPAAIAEQEEYLKRRAGCGGAAFVKHRYESKGEWSECSRCGVTETREDYQAKLESQNDR